MEAEFRNAENTIEVKLTGDAWKCMRILHERPETVSAAVDYLADRTGWKARHIADVLLKSLVQQGYLLPRSFRFTEEGERLYRQQLACWQAVVWRMRDWPLPQEVVQDMADRMLGDVTPDFLAGSLDRMEFDQLREGADAESERISESDFQGILRHGSYRVEFTLLDGNGDFSVWNDCFARSLQLIIEPLRSRLQLSWQSPTAELLGLSYMLSGKTCHAAAENNTVEISLLALSFERVPAYRLLDGEMFLVLEVRAQGGEVQQVPLRLLLPLLYV